MGMKFESNIMFSAAAHVTLIAVALIFAGRGAVYRVPEQYIRVTLVGQENEAASAPSGRRSPSAGTAPAAPAGKPEPSPSHHKAVKALSHEHKRSVVRPARVAVPLPNKRAEVLKATPPEAGEALTEDKKELLPATEGRNVLSGRKRFTIDISDYSTAGPSGEIVGTGSQFHSDAGGASPSDGSEKGGGIHGTIKAGQEGRNQAIGEIRALIEKARRYPLIARNRGIEGTVTAEFSINTAGSPVNVRIKSSSGFAILDSAAKETIIRAAPFPVVKGKIEVPITFRLKREE